MMNDYNPLLDANKMWEAGRKAIQSSSFKYETQYFEMNQLIETAKVVKRIKDKTYKSQKTREFIINERGKTRNVSSNVPVDKMVNHCLCDYIVTPSISKYLIYDNCASQKNKGVDMSRRRLHIHLQEYYNEHKSNDGYILLLDFKGYYANIDHKISKEILLSKLSADEYTQTIIDNIYESFNKGGIDIGNQLSQDIGVLFPYMIDNYVKIVKRCKYYGRYTDDSYVLGDKDFLWGVLYGINKIADKIGIVINQ